jgi:hypothetical protein
VGGLKIIGNMEGGLGRPPHGTEARPTRDARHIGDTRPTGNASHIGDAVQTGDAHPTKIFRIGRSAAGEAQAALFIKFLKYESTH